MKIFTVTLKPNTISWSCYPKNQFEIVRYESIMIHTAKHSKVLELAGSYHHYQQIPINLPKELPILVFIDNPPKTYEKSIGQYYK